MDHSVVKFAEVVIIMLGAGTVCTIGGVLAHRYVERTNQLTRGRSPEDDDRLQRLEHAVDAIAIEVERISEGQRFTAKLLAERKTTE